MTQLSSPAQSSAFDFYLDLRRTVHSSEGLHRYLTVFASRIPLGPGQRLTAAIADHAVIVHGDERSPVRAGVSPCAQAVQLAHAAQHGLFVITDAWVPDADALQAIAQLGGRDPNIGTVQPRFAVGASRDVVVLPPNLEALGLLPRPLVGMLPEFYVTPELDAACIYVTPQAVPACDVLRADLVELPFIDVLIRLRRRGFRSLVANRIVVDFPHEPKFAYPTVIATDSLAVVADAQTGKEWFARSPIAKLERMLANGINGGRKRLLLDCRGMTPAHNGSGHAILGYLEGISAIEPRGWEITICVGRQAAEFHELNRRFPSFRYEFERPRSNHLVAIHLSQPWSMDIMDELHECAPLVAFNILDTIAWDAIYPAPPDLDAVTRFAARFADGLTYLSEHSQLRFRFRFTPHERMREAITYLSLSPQDYGPGVARHTRQELGILVVGNRFDHKDVDRTTDKLAEAFPFTPIVAFGTSRSHTNPNVRGIPSGHVDDASVRDLFERASVIVYPSFSEGFGIPVVRGLALGKSVIARELPLWDEIRLRSSGDGQLVCFRTDAELVEAVGNGLRHVKAPAGDPATQRNGSSIGWRECAAVLLEFADGLVQDFSYDHWQTRDLALTRAR